MRNYQEYFSHWIEIMSTSLSRRLDRLIIKRNTPDAALMASINASRARLATLWNWELKPLTPEVIAHWPRTSEQWKATADAAWAKLGMVRP